LALSRSLAITAERPAQPAQEFPLAALVELGALAGRLAGGDSLGAYRIGERHLQLAAAFLLFLEQAFGAVDPAAFPLELCHQRRDDAFHCLPDKPGDVRPRYRGRTVRGESLATTDLLRRVRQEDKHPDNAVVWNVTRSTKPARTSVELAVDVRAIPR
jgi:hypothetical protein